METLKVLYVDDHIPTGKDKEYLYLINQEEIRVKLKEKESGLTDENLNEWASVYYNASLVRQTLDEAYHVTLANHHHEAMKLASKYHYDIAIVDIGWTNDNQLPGSKTSKETAGWAICDKIKETDQKLNCNPTLQIAYSSRFVLKSELSADAIGRGVLPFFKTRINAGKEEIDANVSALKAVVKFLATQLTSRPPEEEFARKAVEDFHNMTIQSYKHAQDRLTRWSNWTLGTLAVSTLILLVGILGAFFWNVQIGILTAISSIIIEIISYLFFNQLDKAQKASVESQNELGKAYEEALEKLYSLSKKNPSGATYPQP